MDNRISRSPKLGSPFPECPTPTSPALYERCKSRCVYGLMDFFHFRQSRAKKHITNGIGSKRNESSIDVGNMVHLLGNSDENCNFTDEGVDHKDVTIDPCNGKAKEIKGQNIYIEQQTNKTSIAKVKTAISSAAIGIDLSRDHGKAPKSSRRPHRFSRYGCYNVATIGHREFSHRDLEHGSSKKLTSSMASQATSNRMHPGDKEHSRSECIGDSRCLSADQINIQLDINEATETFINQNLIGRKVLSDDMPTHQCEHFFDAIEILSSNKDLFIKLLQNPDSILAKRVENLDKFHAKRQLHGSSTEAKNCSRRDIQSYGNVVQLRTSRTSLQNCEDRTEHDSLQFGHSLKNVQQSVRPAPFAFDRLKRMLNHARRLRAKEKPCKLSDHTTSSCICNSQDFEKCTPAADKNTNRSNTGCETAFDTKTTDSMEVKEQVLCNKVKTFGSGDRKEASTRGSKLENSKASEVSYMNGNEPALLAADQKSRSKSLSSGKADFPMKYRPKTWNEMMHIHDYDLLPVFSPQRTPEHGFVYPQKRFSSYGTWQARKDKWMRNCRERDNSYWSSLRKNKEAPEPAHHEDQFHQLQILRTSKNITVKNMHDAEMHGVISSFENDSCPQGFEKMMKANGCETLKLNRPVEEPFELGGPTGHSSNQSIDIAHLNMEVESLGPSLVWDVHNLKSSSPTHECSSRMSSEETVSIRDPGEHSSPVSVLERYFVDDDTATSSMESKQVGPSTSTLSQQFDIQEDQRAGVTNENHGFVFKYIFEVLQASFVKWDDFTSNYHVPDQFLGQILWKNLERWPNQLDRDHNLLVDFIIEAIKYLHQQHFTCPPWLLFVLPKLGSHMAWERFTPKAMNYLSQHLNLCPPPRTLQQVVEKDLTRLGMWMDIGANTDDIIAEMVESILDELMIEAAIE